MSNLTDFDWWTSLVIPADGYLLTKVSALHADFSSKFGFMNQYESAFDAIKSAVSTNFTGEWAGVDIVTDHGSGKIIDPIFVNNFGYKIRAWLGAFIYVLLVMWLAKKAIPSIVWGKNGSD